MEFPRAGSRHDRPLGGIPQRSAECCDLSGNLHRTRHYLKSRMGIDLAKEPIERDIASGIGFAKQNRDLKQGDGADRNGLMPANSIPQNARLLTRKLFGRRKAPNDYMRVEKKARIQLRAPLRRRRTSQRPDVWASARSSGTVTFPSHMPSGDFQADRCTGPALASGRPRFVIVIVPPRSPIPSSSARHFALNSVTLTI